jgi:acetyl/propionyl-CoA carboxylase alpha subunit
MFGRVLITNRGLIQANCVRAIKELGATAIVVYEKEDKDSIGVRSADEAYEIAQTDGPRPYYDIDRMVQMAEDVGADAVHPGYGFLAQNGEFLQKLRERGITPIAPEMLEALSDKPALKKMAMDIGLPILPGSGTHTELAQLEKAALELGYPLVIKATRGYGGKGIRVVEKPEDLPKAFEYIQDQCKKYAIGSDAVFVEKYLPNARHIEFPVLRDSHGNTLVFPEQECSIQRRFQKLLVETPSAALDEQTRGKIQAIVQTLANQLNVVGFASIEFLYYDKLAYFLEVNAYMQPSHSATSLLTGMDILKEQIRLVAGEPLTVKKDQISTNAHVIGAYVAAEDPSRNFAPSPGRLQRFTLPFGEGVHLQTSVFAGDEVNTYYDPMIAKILVRDLDRDSAVRKMQVALEGMEVQGVKHNIALLRGILSSDEFVEGKLLTVALINEPTVRARMVQKLQKHTLDEVAGLVAALSLHYDRNAKQILENAEHEETFWSMASRWFNRDKKMEPGS